MTEKNFITLQDLRQPGMRHILEAMKTIRNEAPVFANRGPRTIEWP